MINIHRYIERTKVEGPGYRFALWLQGCSRKCKGCFARDTWSHENKLVVEVQELADMINSISGIEGITVLGGEPFEQAKELAELIMSLRKDLSIIVFTGFKMQDLLRSNDDDVIGIINSIDVLVDGEYIDEKRELDRPMVGSSNQEFHFLTAKYCMDDFPDNDIEVRVNKNGSILINGNGRIERIIV